MRYAAKGMGNSGFTIAKRFCGPGDSGNGGYVAGSIAQRVDFAPARVMLLKPPPLEVEITVQQGDRGMVACTADGTVIAACSPGTVDLDIPPVPSVEEAREATSRFVMAKMHYFPECFVCGTERPDDGLCIHPGLVAGSDVIATTWTPDDSLPNKDGVLDSELVWAALDCPSGTASLAREFRPIVLGKLCVEIRGRVSIGEEVIVMGWQVSKEGVKEHVGSAIATVDGEILAVAAATWIVLPESQTSFKLRE